MTSTALPIPADVAVGHVVRLRLGSQVYISPVLSPTEAGTLFEHVFEQASTAHPDGGFVPFTCVDGRRVRVKARAVTAIEVGPLHTRAERPAAETPEQIADRIVTA